MTQLSKLAKLGIARESTPNTYQAPNMWLPYEKADFSDDYTGIKDESVRGNDTVLQGYYQGSAHATWSIDLFAYPDIAGHMLRAIIGPDTVTAGVSTTLSAATTAGATTITTAATIPANSTVMIDTGAVVEYAVTGTPSGAGPYTIPITSPAAGLVNAHTSGATVVAASTHKFKQSIDPTTKPTYSFLVWDTVQWLSYTGAACSECQIKIDPKAAVTMATKWTSLLGTTATSAIPAYTQPDPILGWEWNMQNAGGSSTRGLTLDVNVKRAVTPINSSDGVQTPREIFQGALEADGTYKAIFENQTDLNLYTANSQQPVVASLQQPLAKGGASLSLSMSKSAWSSGKRDMGTEYVEASFSIEGVYNATDGGAVSATLTNFVTTTY